VASTGPTSATASTLLTCRIEAERKSDVTIIVNDANGLALDGAVVSVRQTEHDFRFGSAISAFDSQLDPNGNATALEYQDEINRLFNTVVVENSLKWDQFINDRHFSAATI